MGRLSSTTEWLDSLLRAVILPAALPPTPQGAPCPSLRDTKDPELIVAASAEKGERRHLEAYKLIITLFSSCG